MDLSFKSEEMNSSMLSILMVCESFYPAYSGAGRQALSLARALAARGHEITVLARHIPNRPFYEVIDGVKLFRIGVKTSSSNIGNIFSQILFAIKGWRWIRRHAANTIVHVHGLALWSMLLLILLGKRQPTLVKMSLVGVDDAETLSQGKYSILFKLAISFASAVVSISPALSKSYLRKGLPIKKLVEIPNGVDTKYFCPVSNIEEKLELRKKLNLPTEGRLIIFVGAISERKGVKYLFDAWVLLAKKHKDVNLILLGPWNKRTSDQNLYYKLKSLAEINAVADRVHFIGFVDDVASFLRASDLFVLPSESEGLPNSLLEAMSCGLTCCVSLLQGISDAIIIDRLDGYLLPIHFIKSPFSFQSFLDEVVCKINNNDVGQRAREKILNNYSIKRVAEQYERVYRFLING